MEKRYQVFISSTFLDLQEERQSVLKAILELDHMPAGMELFPATDDSAWQLIQDVIDHSDYYALIIGGRYGSSDAAGLGYTEKEYDYANSQGIPIIPLLHQNPETLPREKTDTDTSTWNKLQKFRGKVERRHTCVYWTNAYDLKAKVIVGLTTAIKRHPRVGWIRADKLPSEATLADVLALKSRVAELELEAASVRDHPPPGTEGLAQGEDQFKATIFFTATERLPDPPYRLDTDYETTVSPTWNEIFAAVAPKMIKEATNGLLRKALQEYFALEARHALKKRKELRGKSLSGLALEDHQIETCIVQLRALGLIKESDRKRSINDRATYWTLTPYGNTVMVQLRAIRRSTDE